MQIKQFPFNKKMLSQKSCAKMFRRRKQKMSKWKKISWLTIGRRWHKDCDWLSVRERLNKSFHLTHRIRSPTNKQANTRPSMGVVMLLSCLMTFERGRDYTRYGVWGEVNWVKDDQITVTDPTGWGWPEKASKKMRLGKASFDVPYGGWGLANVGSEVSISSQPSLSAFICLCFYPFFYLCIIQRDVLFIIHTFPYFHM